VENFRLGKTWVLIATDLIGRGMDFVGVNTVINYDFPYSTADYVHRWGAACLLAGRLQAHRPAGPQALGARCLQQAAAAGGLSC
jgi:hypothetical protein